MRMGEIERKLGMKSECRKKRWISRFKNPRVLFLTSAYFDNPIFGSLNTHRTVVASFFLTESGITLQMSNAVGLHGKYYYILFGFLLYSFINLL